MNPEWHFNPRRPCDRMRDSANDAFFTAESLENLSEALVREGIQNSLDAAERAAVIQRAVVRRQSGELFAVEPGHAARGRYPERAVLRVVPEFANALSSHPERQLFRRCATRVSK